ncbi:MAG: hypothetical protein O3A53_21190 [Acidobacteria bacterium]|nr:hypothetical protein [Acidobacteriota bacterium]MDA1237289.1 hypothetical protein [Acidobacteriota bacterium]
MMNELILAASPIVVSIGAACLVWKLARRSADLRRRVVREEAESQLLRGRLDDALALFEARLLRLEGVKGYSGSRSRQRRHAADLVRLGGDPMATAKRCELPAVELQVLLQLDELRTRRTAKALN